jgi:tRNA threonylcarbamoyladenosine modification (KEOPS) complex Cgi121 subunit
MTMIEALEKLAELNNYDDVLVQTNVGELKAIDFAIDDIRNYADEEDEIFDLEVTEETIREFDENGYLKHEEPLYRVVKEEQ